MATSLEMHVACQLQVEAAELLISAAQTALRIIFRDAVCTDVGEMVQAAGAVHTTTKAAAEKCSGALVKHQTVTVTVILQILNKVQRQRYIRGMTYTKCAEAVHQEEV